MKRTMIALCALTMVVVAGMNVAEAGLFANLRARRCCRPATSCCSAPVSTCVASACDVAPACEAAAPCGGGEVVSAEATAAPCCGGSSILEGAPIEGSVIEGGIIDGGVIEGGVIEGAPAEINSPIEAAPSTSDVPDAPSSN
ncbi:MAG: hypothetical protein R3E01_17430 [Pirellulaceae bacterium]|nr:hypothetical protein [Planctomycetales bacterium]